MTLLQTILAFLAALGPLIIFHELGHYAVARLAGVKVLRFSVGMGKVVWSRRFGPDQTEWAVSALPLGGYVKMLDNRDPATAARDEHEARREFTRQNVWKRIAIVAAGPAANFLLAIVLFSVLYMIGVPEAGTRIGTVAESSAAWQAGLRAGDRIAAVNGEPVHLWSQLRNEVLDAALDGREISLDVQQGDSGSYRAVLRPARLAALDEGRDVTTDLGLTMFLPPAHLGQVMPGGAAAKAGLQTGDVIVAIDGVSTPHNGSVTRAIRDSGGKLLQVHVRRGAANLIIPVQPELDRQAKVWRIMAQVISQPELVKAPTGPISAVARAAGMTWDQAVMSVRMIGRMIIGELSIKNVTGPITIADYAGQTARQGAVEFFYFIAFVSIGLGVMNLLPIPVLDGGHLLYYLVEVLTGRPLPERVSEFAQRAGLGLLFMLMALAVFNDVVRLL